MPISDLVRSQFSEAIELALDSNMALSAYDEQNARLHGVINNIVCAQSDDVKAFVDEFFAYSEPRLNLSDGNGGFDFEPPEISDNAITLLSGSIVNIIP